MKIAFVHYHLNTGGVTAVLKRQVAAIHKDCDALILTGQRAAAQWPCPVAEISGLGYGQSGPAAHDPNAVAEQVLATIARRWPGGCDVLHVHNPTLAKNRCFLQVIKRLQQAGVKLFLQIHDFAEDGRPQVYFTEAYPADCHYGVINSRDERILRRAGLKCSGLHYLPNPIETRFPAAAAALQPRVLYPVRAIRRKNIGEAILLAQFIKSGLRIGITRPPTSAADIASYRDWVSWVKSNRLPVDFEVGQRGDFSTLVATSESMLTTSVAEGFGLTFLEPWVAGKLLWGRRLGEICEDFQKNGLHLDTLYEGLDVPLAWIDAAAFYRKWQRAVFDAAARYGCPSLGAAVSRACSAGITRGDGVDFGILSEPFQRQVLDRLIADPAAKPELIARNVQLGTPGEVAEPGAMIANNRAVVLQHYGLAAYRKRLLGVYDQVMQGPVRQGIDKTVVLRAFFQPQRLSLLQWGTYDRL